MWWIGPTHTIISIDRGEGKEKHRDPHTLSMLFQEEVKEMNGMAHLPLGLV